MRGYKSDCRRQAKGCQWIRAISASAIAAIACMPRFVAAGSATWTGAGGTDAWGNAANWTTNGVAGVLPANNDDVTFLGTGQGSVGVQLGSNRTVNSLTFGISGEIINDFTLDSPGASTILTDTTGIINAGSVDTINSILSSSNGLNISGGEPLALTNSNAITGNITINGNVQIQADANFGSAGGSVTLGAAGSYASELIAAATFSMNRNFILIGGQLGYDFISVNGGDSLTLNGTVSGAAVQLVSCGQGTLNLTNSNNSFGSILVEYGAVEFSSNGALGAAGGYVNMESGTGLILAPSMSAVVNRTISLVGGAPACWIEAGPYSTLTLSGVIQDATFDGDGKGQLVVNGNIYDAGSVVVTGTSNTYSGGTLINGILSISSDANLGAAGTAITFGENDTAFYGDVPGVLITTASMITDRPISVGPIGAVLEPVMGTTLFLSGSINGSGGITIAGQGQVDITLASGNTFIGGITLQGDLRFLGDSQLGGSSNSITFTGSNATLECAGTISSARALSIASSSAATFDIDSGDTLTLSGTITGGISTSLAKTGTGTLTLTGSGSSLTNVYIDSGLLVIHGGSPTLAIAGDLDLGSSGANPTVGLTLLSGSLNVDGTLNVYGNGSSSTLSLYGNELIVNAINLLPDPSALHWTQGTLDITGSGSAFGGGVAIPLAGTLELGPQGAVTDPIAIDRGGTLLLDANTGKGMLVRTLNTITIGPLSPFPFGGQMLVQAATTSASRQLVIAAGLIIGGSMNAWLGKLDLANNDMDIQAGSLAAVTSQIAEGYNNGAWNGSEGIVSSIAAADSTHLTALGVIQNNQSGAALFTSSHLFDGTAPGAGDILIKYTYCGDANLDGKVDASDYTRIDNGCLNHLTGWFNGDFNYDGIINGSDYTLIDNAFNTQGAQISAQTMVATAEIEAVTPVPEPALPSFVAIGAVWMLARFGARWDRVAIVNADNLGI